MLAAHCTPQTRSNECRSVGGNKSHRGISDQMAPTPGRLNESVRYNRQGGRLHRKGLLRKGRWVLVLSLGAADTCLSQTAGGPSSCCNWNSPELPPRHQGRTFPLRLADWTSVSGGGWLVCRFRGVFIVCSSYVKDVGLGERLCFLSRGVWMKGIAHSSCLFSTLTLRSLHLHCFRGMMLPARSLPLAASVVGSGLACLLRSLRRECCGSPCATGFPL